MKTAQTIVPIIFIFLSFTFTTHVKAQKMFGHIPESEAHGFHEKTNIQFYDTIKIKSIRQEKRHNKTILKLTDKYGDCWADTLTTFMANPSDSLRNRVLYTTYSFSIHRRNEKKRLGHSSFFNPYGFVTKKEANVRSNKRKYITKVWTFDENGEYLNCEREVHKRK